VFYKHQHWIWCQGFIILSNNGSNLNSSSPKVPCPSIPSHVTPPYHHVTIIVGSSLELCTDYQQHMLFFLPLKLPTAHHPTTTAQPQVGQVSSMFHFNALDKHCPQLPPPLHKLVIVIPSTLFTCLWIHNATTSCLSFKKITLSSLGSYSHDLQRRAQHDSAIPASSLTEVELMHRCQL
jgi:hypothetical protein